jgi:hypothetical protein
MLLPMLTLYSCLPLTLLHLLALISSSAADGTWSLDLQPDFLHARNCVQTCLDHGPSQLVYAIDCPPPWYDSCVCREDLRPIGSSALTKCVDNLCSSNSADLSQVVGIWDSYCSRDAVGGGITTLTVPTCM